MPENDLTTHQFDSIEERKQAALALDKELDGHFEKFINVLKMIKDRKLYQELGCKSIKDYLRKKFPFYTLTFLIGLSHLVEKIDDISQLKEVSWSSVEPLVKAANDTDVAYIDNSEGKVTLKGNQEMTIQESRELVDSRHEKEKTELKTTKKSKNSKPTWTNSATC